MRCPTTLRTGLTISGARYVVCKKRLGHRGLHAVKFFGKTVRWA